MIKSFLLNTEAIKAPIIYRLYHANDNKYKTLYKNVLFWTLYNNHPIGYDRLFSKSLP